MKLCMQHRRGQFDASRSGEKMLYFAVVLIVLVIGIFVFLGATWGSVLSAVRVPEELELRLLMSRLYMSPDCLAYRDHVTGRVYPGIIDATQDKTLGCYNDQKGNPIYAFRVTAYDEEAIVRVLVNELATSRWQGDAAHRTVEKKLLAKYLDGDEVKTTWAHVVIEVQKLE